MNRAALLLPLFWASICAFARSADNGAPSGVLTLHECITECLRGNPRLASEQFTLAADKENIWKARSAFLPDLTGHAEIAGLSGSPSGCWALLGINDPDVTGTVETRSASRQAGQTGARQGGRGPFRIGWGCVGTGQLKLEYPLYANSSIFGLNNFPALATAKAQYNKQTWTLRLAEQDVTANLVGVFYSPVAYLNKVELDQQTVELSKKRLEILQEELRLNLTLPQYVEVAKQQLAANQQVLTTSQERAADSERMLRELLRRPGTQKLRIDTSDPLIPGLPPLEGLLNRVSAEHPSVAMQRANIEEAKQHYHLSQAALYPSVNFQTTYSGGTAFGSFPLDQYFVGIGVDVPIFDFGHKLSAEHESLDLLKAAQAQLEQVQFSLREAILNQISSIHTNEAELADLERNYVEAKTQVDLIQSEHDQGIATQLALVDAQLSLHQVKDQLSFYVQLIPIYGYLGPCIAFFASEAATLTIWANKLTRLGLPVGLGKIVWRPLVASTCIIGVALYLIKGVAVIWLVPATLLALVVYLLILLLLGMYTESDLRLAKEGLGFVKPFLAKWTGQAAALK